jgi:glutaredoxin 3
MAQITIYTTMLCPFCHMAKNLLRQKDVTFDEIDVTGRPDLRAEMRERAGRNTVPQIFIDGDHIGGCDDLYALERSGGLDAKLRPAG